MKEHLATIADGRTLSEVEAQQAMTEILGGEVHEAELAGFLLGLRARGETVKGAKPGGAEMFFCEPLKTTSTSQTSVSTGTPLNVATVSRTTSVPF